VHEPAQLSAPRPTHRPPGARHFMALVLFLAAALSGGTVAGEPRTAADHLAQAQLYLDRGREDLALAELTAGRRAPGGQQLYPLRYLLARLYSQRLQLEEAFPEARAAVSLARTPAETAQAEELVAQLASRYSGVRIRSANPAIERLSSLQIEEPPGGGGLVGLEKKQLLAALARRLAAQPLPLPTTIYLPHGFYLIDGTPVEVRRGEEAEVRLLFAGPDREPRTAPSGHADQALLRKAGLVAGGALLVGLLLLLLSS